MLLLISKDTVSRAAVFMLEGSQNCLIKQPLTLESVNFSEDSTCALPIFSHVHRFKSLFLIIYNSEAVSKLISPHQSKPMGPDNHYYLFVDFPSSKEALSAIDALDGEKGPWGGKIRIYSARGNSWKPDERQKWGAVRENDLSTTAKTNFAA